MGCTNGKHTSSCISLPGLASLAGAHGSHKAVHGNTLLESSRTCDVKGEQSRSKIQIVSMQAPDMSMEEDVTEIMPQHSSLDLAASEMQTLLPELGLEENDIDKFLTSEVLSRAIAKSLDDNAAARVPGEGTIQITPEASSAFPELGLDDDTIDQFLASGKLAAAIDEAATANTMKMMRQSNLPGLGFAEVEPRDPELGLDDATIDEFLASEALATSIGLLVEATAARPLHTAPSVGRTADAILGHRVVSKPQVLVSSADQ